MDTGTERSTQLVRAWIPAELREKLEAAAQAADRSRSAELRVALRAHLERAAPDDEGGTST